eukprot:scaffold306671_cov32-Tisochrysis_lutea.AAC.2
MADATPAGHVHRPPGCVVHIAGRSRQPALLTTPQPAPVRANRAQMVEKLRLTNRNCHRDWQARTEVARSFCPRAMPDVQ